MSIEPLYFSLFEVCKSSSMEIFNTFCHVWLFLVTQFCVYVPKNVLCSSSVFRAIGLLMENTFFVLFGVCCSWSASFFRFFMLFSMFLIPLGWLNCCLPMLYGSTRLALSLLIANFCFVCYSLLDISAFLRLAATVSSSSLFPLSFRFLATSEVLHPLCACPFLRPKCA